MRAQALTITALLAVVGVACDGGSDGGTTAQDVIDVTTTIAVADAVSTAPDSTEPALDAAYETAVCEVLQQSVEQPRPSEQFTYVADGLDALTPPSTVTEQQAAVVRAHRALAEAWLSTQVQDVVAWTDQLAELAAPASERTSLAPDCDQGGEPDAPTFQFWEAQYAGDQPGIWLTYQVTCPDAAMALTDLDQRLQPIPDEADFYAVLGEGPQGPAGMVRGLDADIAFGAVRPLQGSCT